MLQRAVFFDRDGVVNIDHGYVYRIENFSYVEGFLHLFRECKRKGYLLFVVTNQSGIGRGYYSLDDFFKITDFMQNDLLARFGFCFDRIYFCPHESNCECSCRKPNIGMIMDAYNEFNIDLPSSYIIGDKESDIEAGINANIGTTILFNPTATNSKAHFIVKNLCEVHSIIPE